MKKKLEPGMAYDTKKLNKVFAFLSIIFLVTTIWVFLDDYIRPWKAIQVEAMKIRKQKIQNDIKLAEKEINQEKLDGLKEQLQMAKDKVAERTLKIKEVERELTKVTRDISNETITNGKANSNVAASAFNYEIAYSKKKPNAAELFQKMRENKALFAESKDRLKALQVKESSLKKQIAELKKEEISTAKEIKGITQKVELLGIALKKTKIDPIYVVRNLPFIDFLDPTLKIEQVVVDKVTDDRYFQQVPKVDRCMTCHTNMDKPGFEDAPPPHNTHPRLDLMVGAKSKHPMKVWGCTACHGGEGHRVNDFNSAAHTPENEEQRKEWVAKYNWHEPHKIPQPMYKRSMTEAGCIKCHGDQEFIPEANLVNEGRRKMEEFGCYGCHKIEGWEHKRTPGPSLVKMKGKLSKEFFKSWVWSPKSFNKHARMPSFFMQDNNKSAEFQKLNAVEVNAMAEYLFKISKGYEPFKKYKGGDVERGKELIGTVGCMSCHGVDGFEAESKKVGAYAGPHLSGTGSKVDPDWLVSWLVKPSHYDPDTIMPSFRLTDKEANDMAAYLLSLRNKKFENLGFEKLDEGLRDELLMNYFTAFDTEETAKKKLLAMTDEERTHELGKRSVGKYGCYSCHQIDGFEGRAPIGPELTKIGSKPLTQFGFNHQKKVVEHSRDGWIKAHLIQPSRWDEGIDKSFGDITKMPNFYMSDAEAFAITVALIGQVGDYIPMKGLYHLDENQKVAEEGMRLANKLNCVGCHQIDGERGDLLKMYDDVNEGPPRLVEQGAKAQSDWFHQFLANVYPIRPWLNVRMPSYELTNEERNILVAGFQAKAKAQTFEENYSKVTWEPGEKKAALEIYKELAACTSCHTHGYVDDEPSAPNLFYAKRRLRPAWIKEWLKNPQAIYPGTLMPNLFIDEDGEILMPDILGGDPERQMDAVIKLILEMGHDEYSPLFKDKVGGKMSARRKNYVQR
ncbi:MAG: c-type cytochrome [Bacteriovoracaceae bacterium]